jgi:exodeoxyribonuclease X
MIIRVFDVETTGLPAEEKTTAVIQIGWTDVVHDDGAGYAFVSTDPVQYLCNPMRANPGLSIEIGAKATHHIEEEDLTDAPAPDIIFRRLVEGADAFACHNKEHDGHYFTGAGKPFVCTLKASKRVWPDMERHSNQYLRYALKLPVDRELATPAHEAGPDSYVTAHLLAALVGEGARLSDLIEWTTSPLLLPILKFGKEHRGKRFEDVPTSYLQWMRREARDLDRDTKFTVNFHLDKQGAL